MMLPYCPWCRRSMHKHGEKVPYSRDDFSPCEHFEFVRDIIKDLEEGKENNRG